MVPSAFKGHVQQHFGQAAESLTTYCWNLIISHHELNISTAGQHSRGTEENKGIPLQFGEEHFNSMGAGQSSDKFHCNRYLNGEGPPSLVQQANDGVNRKYNVLNGCQPEGQMTCVILHRALPGFPNDNTMQINFMFPDGIQTEKDPHPGQPYSGLHLCAYLPDNLDGGKVFKLLDKAFHQQLLFNVAAGKDGGDMVNSSIPLKIQADGGNQVECYPDSDYLKTVRKLLKDNGIE